MREVLTDVKHMAFLALDSTPLTSNADVVQYNYFGYHSIDRRDEYGRKPLQYSHLIQNKLTFPDPGNKADIYVDGGYLTRGL